MHKDDFFPNIFNGAVVFLDKVLPCQDFLKYFIGPYFFQNYENTTPRGATIIFQEPRLFQIFTQL
jgi:hypothetical protein